ncbi:MAG: CvpA family protein [Bacteroidaceae bacterium]|nr:CvpA family protein [Bacteroidaceae bacterium]
MQLIDIIIFIIVLAGIVVGFRKGFIKQLASLVGLIVGLLAAKALYGVVGDQLLGTVTSNSTFAHTLAFVLIWVVVPIVFTLVASLLTKALEIISLGWLNSLLGAAFGAIKWLLFISLAICLLEYIDSDSKIIDKETKKSSALYYQVRQLAGMFMPTVTDFAEDILKTEDGTKGQEI